MDKINHENRIKGLEAEVKRLKKEIERLINYIKKNVAYSPKEMEKPEIVSKGLFERLSRLATKKQIINELDKITGK